VAWVLGTALHCASGDGHTSASGATVAATLLTRSLPLLPLWSLLPPSRRGDDALMASQRGERVGYLFALCELSTPHFSHGRRYPC